MAMDTARSGLGKLGAAVHKRGLPTRGLFIKIKTGSKASWRLCARLSIDQGIVVGIPERQAVQAISVLRSEGAGAARRRFWCDFSTIHLRHWSRSLSSEVLFDSELNTTSGLKQNTFWRKIHTGIRIDIVRLSMRVFKS